MLISTIIIFCLLAWVTAIEPYRKARAEFFRHQAHERWRDARIYIIKKYHPAFRTDPELDQLSFADIAERFNVEGTYNQIR